MSVTPEFWHPAGEIYISRPIVDSAFAHATEQLHRLMGPGSASIRTRNQTNAAVTLINEADMRYALRASPQLHRYGAEEIESQLLDALPTRNSFYRARLGKIVLLNDTVNSRYTLTAFLDEKDILDEHEAVLDTLRSLAGRPLFEDATPAHVTYAYFNKEPSPQVLKKFEAHYVPDAYQVGPVKSKPLQAAA